MLKNLSLKYFKVLRILLHRAVISLPGVFCVLAGLLYGNRELAILQIIFSLVGKFGASACFAIVYVYTGKSVGYQRSVHVVQSEPFELFRPRS